MENKHTPGPWIVEDGGFVGGLAGYGRICQFWNRFEEYFGNADANASLIAAAPELLEVARMALEAMAMELGLACAPEFAPRELFEKAKAAIAKAEGK